MPDEPNRRQVLKGAAVLGGLAVVGGAVWAAVPGDLPAATDRPAAPSAEASDDLDSLAQAVVSGGPGKDGIPAIDEPKFVSAQETGFLADDERVFGLVHRGVVRAYPQLVLVWHEIVNDTIAGQPISITYCPLTGTVIGFTGVAGRALTFGTTGNLVNSNLLMYDRETDSEWPQILGTAISGKLKGRSLRTLPLLWTTWRAWRTNHPDTEVLSSDTDALRDYGRDPYGSYPDRSGYYAGGEPIFPAQHEDDRFGPKDVVVGVRHGGEHLAIVKRRIRERGVIDTEVGGRPIRAQWDPALGTARVTCPDTADTADFLDAMWFAWYAFYPGTRVVT